MASPEDIADFNRRSRTVGAAVPIQEIPKLSEIVGSPDLQRLSRMREFDRRMDEWRKSLITSGVLSEKQAITTASPAASTLPGAAGQDGLDGVDGVDGKDGVDGANGKNLVAIPPDQLGLVQHVWIAFRTDGVPGTGSIIDPFDGSTADKFDGVMAGLDTYTDIHIGPGVFETRGNRDGFTAGGWFAKEGWRISGSGIDVTVLKMIDCPTAGALYSVVANYRSGGPSFGDLIEICDFTVDCNLRGQSANVAVGAVLLQGKYLRCRRVRCIDWGTKYPGRECFIVALSSYNGGDTTGVLAAQIEDCICDEPYEGVNAFSENSSAIVAGQSGKTPPDNNNYDYNALIRRCIVDGTRTDGLMVPMARLTCFGVFGKGAPIVEDNLAINAGVGVWNDSWVERNVLIKNNRFINVLNGVAFNMGTAWTQFFGDDSYARTYKSITSISSTTTTATVNAVGHGFATGNWVDIRGSGFTQYDGVWKITVTDADHFTFTIASFSGSSSTGQVVKVDARAMNSLVRSLDGLRGIVDAGVRHGLLVGAVVQIGGVTGADAAHYNREFAFVIGITDTTFTYTLAGTAAADAPAGEKVWWDRSGIAPSATPLSSSGTTATFTTQVKHNYEVGDLMLVTGVEGGGSNSNYNGYFLITAVTDFTFSYKMAGTAAESTVRARYQNIWTLKHIQIDGNYIELTGPPLNDNTGAFTGAGISLNNIFVANTYQVPDQRAKVACAIFQNVVVRGNIIRLLDGVANGISINWGIVFGNIGNGIVEDNIVEAGRLDIVGADGRLAAWQPTVPQGVLRFSNNRTFEGKLVRCYEINSSRYYDEPERTFESVQLLQTAGF